MGGTWRISIKRAVHNREVWNKPLIGAWTDLGSALTEMPDVVGYVLLDLFLCDPRKVDLTVVCGCQGWGGRRLVAVKACRRSWGGVKSTVLLCGSCV